MTSPTKELAPIDETIAKAERFFDRQDVQHILQEAMSLSNEAANYQLGKTLWSRQYSAPHPSKQKRDALHELSVDIYYICMAINRNLQGRVS